MKTSLNDSLILTNCPLITIRAEAETRGSVVARSLDIVEVVRQDGTVRKMKEVEHLEPGNQDSEVLPVGRWELEDIHLVLVVRMVADPEIRNLAALEGTSVAFLVRRKELRLDREVVDSGLDHRRNTIQEEVVLVGDHQELRTLVEEE